MFDKLKNNINFKTIKEKFDNANSQPFSSPGFGQTIFGKTLKEKDDFKSQIEKLRNEKHLLKNLVLKKNAKIIEKDDEITGQAQTIRTLKQEVLNLNSKVGFSKTFQQFLERYFLKNL